MTKTQNKNCNEAKVLLAVFPAVALCPSFHPWFWTCTMHTFFCECCHISKASEVCPKYTGSDSRLLYVVNCSAFIVHTTISIFIKTQWFDYRIGEIFISSFFSIFWFSCVKCFNLTNLKICFHFQLIINYVNSKKLFQNMFLYDLLWVAAHALHRASPTIWSLLFPPCAFKRYLELVLTQHFVKR